MFIMLLSLFAYYVLQDCFTAITDFFNERLHIIGYIGIGVAGVMVMIYKYIDYLGVRSKTV